MNKRFRLIGRLWNKWRLVAEVNQLAFDLNRHLEEAASSLHRFELPKFFRTEKRALIGLLTARQHSEAELRRMIAQLKQQRQRLDAALDRLAHGRGQMRSLSAGIKQDYLTQLRQVEQEFAEQLAP